MMPRGHRRSDEELGRILGRYNQLLKDGHGIKESYQIVGEEFGIDWRVVGITINRLQPTVEVARAKLRSAASRLADRVIKKANVDQAIKVLQNPVLGVLEPDKVAESGGAGGFFLAVSMDSLGGVRAVAGSAPAKALDARRAPENEEAGVADGHIIEGEGLIAKRLRAGRAKLKETGEITDTDRRRIGRRPAQSPPSAKHS